MNEGIVQYKSLRRHLGFEIFCLLLAAAGGYFLTPFFTPQSDLDLLAVISWFFLMPLAISSIGFVIGWKAKKDAVDYTGYRWEFDAKQYRIEEVIGLFRDYKRRYSRLIPESQFWYFFVPVLLILATLSVPLYSFFYMTWLTAYVDEVTALLLVAIFAFSSYGGFRATSNDASEDFKIPLIRESLDLARTQEDTPGVSQVRIVLDAAQHNDLAVYRVPRVLVRISGIEEQAYIESLTEELGAVSSIFCRLLRTDDTPAVDWWWTSRDRLFRKHIGGEEEGYYVKLPVPTKKEKLGVKDVSELTANAVALVSIEAIKREIASNQCRDILRQLDVPEGYPSI